MRYCEYEFYRDDYKGAMPESLFNRLSIIASAKIKASTFSRIDEASIPVEVKYCACTIADQLKEMQKSDGKKSESVGSWSVNYEDSEIGKKKLNDIMKDYLSESTDINGTPLLYRGC